MCPVAATKSQLAASAEEIVALADAVGVKESRLQVDLVFSLRLHRREGPPRWVAECHGGAGHAETPEGAISSLAGRMREKLATKIAESRAELDKLERTLTPLRASKPPPERSS